MRAYARELEARCENLATRTTEIQSGISINNATTTTNNSNVTRPVKMKTIGATGAAATEDFGFDNQVHVHIGLQECAIL